MAAIARLEFIFYLLTASKCISPVMRKATAQIMTNKECEYNFGSAFVGAGTVCTRYSGSGICGV